MAQIFENLPPYIQALIAGIITWLLTALGAAAVFVFKKVNDKVLNSAGFCSRNYDCSKFLVIITTSNRIK